MLKRLTAVTLGLIMGSLPLSGESSPIIEQRLADPMDLSQLKEMLLPNPFVISSEKIQEINQSFNLPIEQLLQHLIPIAQTFAIPPISNFKVGAAGLGKSGTIYLGVNLEFPGAPLNESIHGEQFLISNARSHGETELVAMAVSAAPCGHCRQFLSEMGGKHELKILIPNTAVQTLSSLLPESFGPKDLGLVGNLMTPTEKKADLSFKSPLMNQAYQAASNSYAPYTNSKSGVAIETKDGQIYRGSYLENAAYNPSISPLQTALISLVADMRGYDEITEVILLEQPFAKISQEAMTKVIVANIAPQAKFTVEKMEF